MFIISHIFLWFSNRFLATDIVGVVESNLVQIGLGLDVGYRGLGLLVDLLAVL